MKLTKLALLIALSTLMLAGCNKKPSYSFDGKYNPALMPRPIGHREAPPVVYHDYSMVYSYPDDPAPAVTPYGESFIDVVQRDQDAAAANWAGYCASKGMPVYKAADLAGANVVQRYYYDEYDGYNPPKQPSNIKRWYTPEPVIPPMPTDVDAVIFVEFESRAKAVSALVQPPDRSTNYHAVVYVAVVRGRFAFASVWVNTFYATYFYDLAVAYPTTWGPNLRYHLATHSAQIGNHEGGHWAFGLADDPVRRDAPAMMRYQNQSMWPASFEETWIRVYGGAQRGVSSAPEYTSFGELGLAAECTDGG